jgi:hypothetical protein
MMITAARAREKADNSTAKIERVLEFISQQIDSAAMSGLHHIYLDEALANHGYQSVFAFSKPVTNLEGAHKVICSKLSENGYTARMVKHSSDIKYFKTIYSQLDEDDPDIPKFSIMVYW